MTATEAEFRQIYDEHFGHVWRWLVRFGVREADLQDMAQKVFVTAYFKLPELENRSVIKSWLFGVCRRVASDYRRSAAMRREIATEATTLSSLAEKHLGSADKTEEARIARAEITTALLDKLPEAQREVFVLAELDEMDGPEIADLLVIPLGTVKSRLRLARKFFQRTVQQLSKKKG